MGKLHILAVMIPGIFIASVAFAQTTPQMNAKQQSRINHTLDTRYSGLDRNSIQWRQNGEGEFEGSFRHKNRDMVATFDKEGNWVQTSEPIEINKLPRSFRNNLSSAYGNGGVTGVQRILTSDNEIYYDVSLRGERHTVRYNHEGNLIEN